MISFLIYSPDRQTFQSWPPLLDTLVCSAFGLQALQDIERRQRPTGLLDQPAIAQIA